MVMWSSILIASLMHFTLNISFYVIQDHEKCEKAPPLASWIAIAAVMMFLWDAKLFPVRYHHVPVLCQMLTETVACIGIVELVVVKGWCYVERFLHHCSRLLLLKCGMSERTYLAYEYLSLGIVTTAFACCVFVVAAMATNLPKIIYRSLMSVESVQLNINKIQNYIGNKPQLEQSRLRPILKSNKKIM